MMEPHAATGQRGSSGVCMKKVEVIEHRRIFDDFVRIEEAHLRHERHDGEMSPIVRRLNVERGDSTAAILVNTAGKVVYLTEQFRYPAFVRGQGWLVELVAGMVDAGESPAECIEREIREEVGFEVDRLEPIGDFFVTPGASSERIFLFCALVSDGSRKSRGGGLASEGEDIKLVELRVDDFLAKVAGGEIRDAKTIIAGYWLRANRARLAPP
jgi:ADP-ribose pyrophosphatase